MVLISPRIDWWHEAQRYCVTCIRSQQVCDFSPSRLDFLPVLSPLCFCQADEGRTFQGKESKERSSWNKLPFLSFCWCFWFTGLSARQAGRRGRTGGEGPSPRKQLTCSGSLSDPFLHQSRCDCKGDVGPGSGLGDHSSRVMAVGTSGNDVGEIR